ncbi:MAG: DNA-directed RNA polymerase sigma-70 factor [Cyclobacteriaceae bacterium]|nr:MAG: DNA-directed RNA polymerase sigma-70 factor [Cyclobacteriaceae bacterium]
MVSSQLNSNPPQLEELIPGCLKGKRRSQQLLYEQYYGFAMAICLRYCNNYEQAVEVVNDGFLKVFTKLNLYNTNKSFKGWMRRIMINSAIDHYRKEQKHFGLIDIERHHSASQEPSAIQKMNYDDVIQQIQLLSPSYRAVFNLYAIDGYSHQEIGELLNISVGTSKSNLSRGRKQLQKALRKVYRDELA